jgi:hypothetical protein
MPTATDERNRYACWRDAVTSRVRWNAHRLRGVERAELPESAEMLRDELAATDGHGA